MTELVEEHTAEQQQEERNPRRHARGAPDLKPVRDREPGHQNQERRVNIHTNPGDFSELPRPGHGLATDRTCSGRQPAPRLHDISQVLQLPC